MDSVTQQVYEVLNGRRGQWVLRTEVMELTGLGQAEVRAAASELQHSHGLAQAGGPGEEVYKLS